MINKKKALDGENNYVQWAKRSNKRFSPITNDDVVEELPPGVYNIILGQQGYYVQKQEVNTDELLDLPIPEIREVIESIKNFWEREDDFKRYGFIFKRGILLHGPPGCGKTCAIQNLVDHIINEKNGLVFAIKSGTDLGNFISFIPNILRVIEPSRPIITLIEDIDGLTNTASSETALLNLLDGIKQTQNIVYIATTNYPERLKERILNRPSRFDRRFKIDHPNDEVREYYFKHKLKKKDLKKIDMEKWVKDSEGLTISHLRELIIQVLVLGNDFDASIKELKSLKKIPSSSEDRESSIGFGSQK